MKKIGIIILVFLLGVFGTLWFSKEKTNVVSETQLFYNGLEKIAKLQVVEGYFTEVHTYKDSKSYWNDLISFDKKALVVVNAKAQIAYDLKNLDVVIDSIAKKIAIRNIPKPEVTIVPDISYYDIQQSALNEFTAKDYNTIKEELLLNLEKNTIVSDLKVQAHDRFFEELSQILILSKMYGWEVIDKTNNVDLKERFRLNNE